MDESEYNKNILISGYLKAFRNISSQRRMPLHRVSHKGSWWPADTVPQIPGAENADELINYIFKLGLTIWSEKLYQDEFGTTSALNSFIDIVKSRNKAKK